jgi:hypothetical protein
LQDLALELARANLPHDRLGEGERAQGDQGDLGGLEASLDSLEQLAVVLAPVLVMDHGVEVKADQDAPVGELARRRQALGQRGGQMFFVGDDGRRV